PLLILNPVLGLQTGLFRTKQATANVTTAWERDQVFLFIYRYDNALVAQSTPGSGVSQLTTGATVAWSRQLSALTTANIALSYARDNLGPPTNLTENLLTTSASLTYALTPSLTSWVSYTFYDRSASQTAFQFTANVISIGLRKEF